MIRKGHYCWPNARPYGRGKDGVQRYICRKCGRTFPEPPGLPQQKTLSCEWNRGRRDRITPAPREIWAAWQEGSLLEVEIIAANDYGDRWVVQEVNPPYGVFEKRREQLPFRLRGAPGVDPDDVT